MNFNTSKETYNVNQYFKQFVEKHDNAFDTNQEKIIEKISKLQDVPFDSDWNYLMTLVDIIERKFQIQQIVSSGNYFRFEFENAENIQDKGETKLAAIYQCCYQVLKEYWKEQSAPPFHRGFEPFDREDLL